MFTEQQTFDLVVDHLRRQGVKAEDVLGGSCRYRTLDGHMCAVGCLIPDELYKDCFEGYSLSSPTDTYSDMLRQIVKDQGHNVNILIDLQAIHDSHLVEDWEESFFELSKKWNLHYTPVSNTGWGTSIEEDICSVQIPRTSDWDQMIESVPFVDDITLAEDLCATVL